MLLQRVSRLLQPSAPCQRIVCWRAFTVTSVVKCVDGTRNPPSPAHVCIVGSGPAGFYTAQQLLKVNADIKVDIYEKLPCPYGLVRFGVAPDHPEVKNCINQFRATAFNERCRFFGNVNVGSDIKTSELQSIYDACILAYGADNDRMLGVPGEDLDGVHSARAFVGWYNGLPSHSKLAPDLSCEAACIIGQGNVALDVARMMLAPTEMLQYTDICEHSLQALKESNVKKIYVIGRRGPLQVSFTIKELREMVRLENCKPIFLKDDFEKLEPLISKLPRQKKRLVELMCNTALKEPSPENKEVWKNASQEWHALFCRSPVEIIGDSNGKVKGIKLEINELKEGDDGSIKAIGTGQIEEIPCGMVLRSIGYKSIQVDEGIPFDKRMGVIPNIGGKVVTEAGSNQSVPGLYCSGWVKHGPVGVILTTMSAAKETANVLLQDLNNGALKVKEHNAADLVDALLQERGVRVVTFEDWERIDDEEVRMGEEVHKPREKIVSQEQMLQIVQKV